MRKFWFSTITLIAILVLFSTDTLTHAQETQPEPLPTGPAAVMQALTDAFNVGDIESGMSYYADEAVYIALPPPPDTTGIFAGKETITALQEELVARNGFTEFIDLQGHGDTVTWTAWFVEDVFREIGIFPILFSGTAVIQDGLVQSETWIMSKQSQAMIDRALTTEQNKEMIRRGYDEMWSQGNMDLVEELHHSDFVDSHTGQPGIESVRWIVTLFRQAFPDMKVTYDNMVAEGDIVVTEVTFDLGVYQGGLEEVFGIPDVAIGKAVTLHGIDYARFKDGKIIDAWGTHDDLGWMEQFGFELVPPAE